MNSNDPARHPCFNREASHEYGRVHLPVAPKCNIRCNYCNRKFDCPNECRPGVSSALLSPGQVLPYLDEIMKREPRIAVAAVAGPGEPFANPEETLKTLSLIRAKYPGLLLCVSTNSLALPAHLEALLAIGVSHVTVTVNAVDPRIGAQIYSWVRDGKVVYHGIKAAELLLSRQIGSIEVLKSRGVIVKVNTIVIPGINDHHVAEVARRMADLNVDLMNVMPMHPNQGTPFADLPEPDPRTMEKIRAQAAAYLPQMTHCRRCRADAVGLLSQDRSGEMSELLRDCSRLKPESDTNRPFVAVATREGLLINLHLGEAARFQIWGRTQDGFRLVEERWAPETGGGPRRWEELAVMLKDCRAVLVSALGDSPRQILQASGLAPYECSGLIVAALREVYASGNLNALRGRKRGWEKSCCSGGGPGCS